MEENLDKNNEVNKEISDKDAKSNSEENIENKPEKAININENNFKKDPNYLDPDNKDDWDDTDNDW